tara:strand:- start:7544 stop:7951 length:408 start_codon:yes stop_codon:yes gene_type:complete
MNTALKNDSVLSTQPKRSGGYQTTNLFRLSDTAIDVESVLKGLDTKLHKYDVPPAPLVEVANPTSANRNSMQIEGNESRTRRAVNSITQKETARYEFPLVDHQKFSVFTELQRGGFHTRNNAKDEYASKCNIGNK